MGWLLNKHCRSDACINNLYYIIWYITFFIRVLEFDELANYLGDYKVFRFSPTEEQLIEYMDGGVAIIDQLICAHAR